MIRTEPQDGKRWSDRLTPESIKKQKDWTVRARENAGAPSRYRYNLTISDQPRFFWYRNAKVATRSIFCLFDDAGLKLVAEQARNCYYSPEYYNDYFKFAFVRNPWERVVSAWKGKIYAKNRLGFDIEKWQELRHFDRFIDYLETLNLDHCNVHFRRQCKLIDTNEVDYIGRLEIFEQDMLEILSILKLPKLAIPHRNKSTDEITSKDVYTPALIKKIGDLYRKDIQLFGYSF